MGTRYILLDKPATTGPAFAGDDVPQEQPAAGVYLDEHSSVFDLVVSPDGDLAAEYDGRPEYEVRCLTFADLRKIRDEIDRVLGYFDE